MKPKLWPLSFPLVFLLVLAVSQPVSAQSSRQAEDDGWIGEVAGVIVNMNAAETATEDLQIMLHGWDQNDTQKFMLHGEVADDGSFLFEEVPLEDGLNLVAMAVYQEATYFSEAVAVAPDQAALELEIRVFESKHNLEGLQIDQMHVLFFFEGRDLSVMEVYILSNLSDRTISRAVVWNEVGEQATLAFGLPEGARNIRFSTNDSARFLFSADGFVDTAPIVPGRQSAQVVVTYNLAYADGGIFSFSPPLPTTQLNFLIDASSEVELSGPALVSQGIQSLENGTRFALFSAGDLPAGETIQVELSGEPLETSPAAGAASAMGASSVDQTAQNLAIGGAVLGAAMLGVGIWWFRAREGETEEDTVPEGAATETGSFDELIADIASLDQAFEAGSLTEAEHLKMRAPLLTHAKTLLSAQTEGTLEGELE